MITWALYFEAAENSVKYRSHLSVSFMKKVQTMGFQMALKKQPQNG